MRVIVFGLGKFYKARRERLMSYFDTNIAAYTDNNRCLWGNTIDGIPIIAPEMLNEIDYDVVLIMSTYAEEICNQLIAMGVAQAKIKFWEAFCAEIVSGVKEIFYGKDDNKRYKNNILIISTALNYDGGTLAAVYAALAMKSRGYNVILAAPGGDSRFITETTSKGVTVYICPSLPYIYDSEKNWIEQFDVVIVNVFQMIQSAVQSSIICPTLWWIHEPAWLFEHVRLNHWNRVSEEELANIGIYAVSRIPKKNFNKFYTNRIQKILHYGIPDINLGRLSNKEKKEKLVFAIIGNVWERKAQDIFCKAVNKMNNKEQAEFWIIGKYGNGPFCDEILKMSAKIESIKMLGLLTREEIYSIFPQIDIVVCASREDPLPIVMTEGMMFGKVCIATDATGTSDYIKNGENGFVIPSEDIDALKEKMEWIVDNQDKLEIIGTNSRKVYEKYFSMEVFGENLEKALIETTREWHAKKRSG